MRVLAASFPDQASARSTRVQLINAFGLDARYIGGEALAERDVSDGAILAGRFQENVVDAARAVVEGRGGTLIIDMDDAGRNA